MAVGAFPGIVSFAHMVECEYLRQRTFKNKLKVERRLVIHVVVHLSMIPIFLQKYFCNVRGAAI